MPTNVMYSAGENLSAFIKMRVAIGYAMNVTGVINKKAPTIYRHFYEPR